MEFNSDHKLKNISCAPSIKVPLATNVTASPAPPTAFRLDCRVRNWQSIQAVYSAPKRGRTIEFYVWQRTEKLGPTANAGPMLDGLLNVTLEFLDGPCKSFA